MNPLETLSGQVREAARAIGRDVRLMEVCGTHTVAIFRSGIRSVLPANIILLSGPGCPVCVTSVREIDAALMIAHRPGVIFATFGDMMKVPGSTENLNGARAEGADIRVVYSPLDAIECAKSNPQREVVFYAAGFETTSPLIAATLELAVRSGLPNYSIYSVHKTVPPALRALLSDPLVAIDGFILPGHVSTMIGSLSYSFISEEFHTPSVIAGFEPEDILSSILILLVQIRDKKPSVEIEYSRAVRPEGNPRAMALTRKYFEPCDAVWRGIGSIPGSGFAVRPEYARLDALQKFGIVVPDVAEPELCECGNILKGMRTPTECPLFGSACTPENPIGPCMVSVEGSCAAYFNYARVE